MESWKPALTILCCLFAVSGALGSCPTCNKEPYDLDQYEVVDKYREMALRVWNQNISLNPLGNEFVAYIKSLNLRTDIITSLRAFFSSVFINYFIPYLNQQPDACFMAAMINATISCVVYLNRSSIRDALTQLQNTYLYDISPRLEPTIALSAGCDFRCGEYPPDPKVNKTVCFDNGLTYAIQDVLNLPINRLTTLKFRTFLTQMYRSRDFNNRFIAACVTFAISADPFEIWNPNIIAEIVDLSTSSPIQRECCYQRSTRAEEIRKIFDENVKSYITYMKQVYASSSKCV